MRDDPQPAVGRQVDAPKLMSLGKGSEFWVNLLSRGVR